MGSLPGDNILELTHDTPFFVMVILGELGGKEEFLVRCLSSSHTRGKKNRKNYWGQDGNVHKKGRLVFYLWLVFGLITRETLLQGKGDNAKEREHRGAASGGTDSLLKFPIPIGLESRSCLGTLDPESEATGGREIEPRPLAGDSCGVEPESFCFRSAVSCSVESQLPLLYNEFSKLGKGLPPTRERLPTQVWLLSG